MVVITGSESFIGKELRSQLKAQGVVYRGLDAIASEDPDCVRVDICDPLVANAIPEGADVLVHLAAISRDKDCAENLTGAFTVNVNGTINLIQAAQKKGVKQFIFASSEWVYGEVANSEVQLEETVIDIRKLKSEYAITKLVGEQMLRLACRDEKMAGTVLRFGIVYGPRPSNWSAVENLFFATQEKSVIEVGSGATARRFIHVKDICSGIRAAMGTPGYQIFNLSGDVLVTLQSIVNEGAAFWKTKPELKEKSPDAVSIRNPDNSKIKRELKWSQQYDLKRGLATLVPEEGKSR